MDQNWANAIVIGYDAIAGVVSGILMHLLIRECIF